jgi:hypothetical protein
VVSAREAKEVGGGDGVHEVEGIEAWGNWKGCPERRELACGVVRVCWAGGQVRDGELRGGRGGHCRRRGRDSWKSERQNWLLSVVEDVLLVLLQGEWENRCCA